MKFKRISLVLLAVTSLLLSGCNVPKSDFEEKKIIQQLYNTTDVILWNTPGGSKYWIVRTPRNGVYRISLDMSGKVDIEETLFKEDKPKDQG